MIVKLLTEHHLEFLSLKGVKERSSVRKGNSELSLTADLQF